MLSAFILVGALIGFWLEGLTGAVFGASIGFLIGWGKRLSDRLAALETREVATGRIKEPDRAPAVSEPVSLQEAPAETPEPLTPEASPGPPRPPEETAPPPEETATPPEETSPAPRSTQWSDAGSTDRISSTVTRVTDVMKGWLTSGNVPVKVGVVLSLFGMAFFIREAIDRELFNLPIEFRLAGVAAFGLGLLLVGWRLRERRRVYALSLQGGGIAVLYLTAYAAFAQYGLIPAAAAFVFLLILTVAGGMLAVLQDARALAVLGIVGGFMAPMLVSSGASEHVLLFSYYAILNIAVVGVAWFKAWRALTLLGFIFTFGIGSLWGYQGYQSEHFATTEPFLILFVLMYTLIPVFFSHH